MRSDVSIFDFFKFTQLKNDDNDDCGRLFTGFFCVKSSSDADVTANPPDDILAFCPMDKIVKIYF